MPHRFWQSGRVACLIFAFAVCASRLLAADPPLGPSKDVPELQFLNGYVGTWEVVMATNEVPNTPIGKGKATAKWILDGRFLEQSGMLLLTEGNKTVKVTTLMTYDVDKKSFRSWTFTSDGQATESDGKWDAATQTMTFISIQRPNGQKVTITANFAEAGIERWKMTVADETGKLISNLIGKNIRQKE